MIIAITSEKMAMDSEKTMPSTMLVRIRLPAEGLRPIANTPMPHARPTPMPVPIAPTPIAKPAANWTFMLVLLCFASGARWHRRSDPHELSVAKTLTIGWGEGRAHDCVQDAEIFLKCGAPRRAERDPRARPLALERFFGG